MVRFVVSVVLAVLLCPAAMAAEGGAVLLGQFKNWAAFSATVNNDKVCYALSQPRATEPKRARRGKIYFLINDWPGRHVKGEAEVVAGYKYKDGSQVTAAVGGDKYTFFVRNNGDDGSAWILSLPDGPKLIDAMRQGVSAVVTGTSSRGTVTHDTYSLLGFNDALAKIDATCGM
jgi:hypothetical protein